jgi:hypothetical protein
MKKLKIIRGSGYYGMIRKLGIFIDGQKVGDVGNGSETMIDVPDGAVSLEGRMDWGKTDPVQIASLKDGQSITFKTYFSFNPLRAAGMASLPFKVDVK